MNKLDIIKRSVSLPNLLRLDETYAGQNKKSCCAVVVVDTPHFFLHERESSTDCCDYASCVTHKWRCDRHHRRQPALQCTTTEFIVIK